MQVSNPSRPAVRLAPLLALFLVSGATSLVYEIVWLRQLILVFGSTLFATSAILSTFMGGLALGSLAGGRVASAVRLSPLRVYAVLEAGIAAYALLVPALLRALEPFYQWVWDQGASESFYLLSLAKLLGIGLVLLPPTTLMGATLPVLSRLVSDEPERLGGNVGALYASNTFGAVLGTFLAGFVLLPSLGLARTTAAAVAANVLVALAAWGLSRGFPGAAPDRPAEPVLRSGGHDERRKTWPILAVFAASGAVAMGLEVLWTRGLALVFGSSVYAFTLMLLAFLLGLAAGGAAFAAWLRRRPGLRPAWLPALVLAGAGVAAFATSHWIPALPRTFAQVYFQWSPPIEVWFVVQFAFALSVMFPATFLFGGVFPLLLQRIRTDAANVPRTVARAYAANTFGTIAGSLGAGFVLVPLLGVRTGILALALVQVLLGGAVAAWGAASGRGARAGALAAAGVLCVVMTAARPGWNVLLMNSGVYSNIQMLEDGATWEDFRRVAMDESVLVYAREGLTASVLVADQPKYRNRYLAVNGKVEASTNADMETQLLCAHLPLLLHPAPKDVLVIGLASGITAGSAAAHPIRRMRIVEVEAAMEPAARLFGEHNRDVLDDPRVELSINDARNELQFRPDTYDVIVSEPSNPWMTVAANLFTRDFFLQARERLNPGGLFAQWVQNYYIAPEDLRSVIAAFREAFPHVYLFQTFEGVDSILIGSDQPFLLDLARMDTRIAELRVRMDLARIDVRDAVDLLPFFVMGPREVPSLVDGAEPNTDDNARVEFSAPRYLFTQTLDRNLELLERFRGDPLAYVAPPPAGPEDEDRLRIRIIRACLRRGDERLARWHLRRLRTGQAVQDMEPLFGPAGL